MMRTKEPKREQNSPEEVVQHEEEGGYTHEGVAHPERVRQAPQALPHHLRVPVCVCV